MSISESVSGDLGTTDVCNICQNLSPTRVVRWSQDPYTIVRIVPIELRLSAQKGCLFCQVVIEAIYLVLGKNLLDDDSNVDRISGTQSDSSKPQLDVIIQIIARLGYPVELKVHTVQPSVPISIALSGTLCKLLVFILF
jgi:hypothetical protein